MGCEVPNGCVARSTPAEGAGFWPELGQICQKVARVFRAQWWNGEEPPVLVCLAGWARTPMDLPRPLDVDVAPSGLLAQHTVRAEWPEIGDLPCGKLAFPAWHVEVVVLARRAVHVLGCVCLCAHGPWGHWGTNHWVVRCPTTVCHALQRPGVPDFGPISAKFAKT